MRAKAKQETGTTTRKRPATLRNTAKLPSAESRETPVATAKRDAAPASTPIEGLEPDETDGLHNVYGRGRAYGTSDAESSADYRLGEWAGASGSLSGSNGRPPD